MIPLLIPLSLRGVRYRPIGASALLRRNLLIYGLGGIVAPFIGIKLIDLIVHNLLGGVDESRQPEGVHRHGPGRRQDLPDAAGGAWPKPRAAATWRSAISSRTAARRRVAQAEGLEIVPRRHVELPRHAAGGDGPAGGARAQAGAVPDRRARPHQRSGSRAREALRGRARRARRRHRRVLDGQRAAPGEPQRPGHPADRARTCARRSPTRCSRRPTRSC